MSRKKLGFRKTLCKKLFGKAFCEKLEFWKNIAKNKSLGKHFLWKVRVWNKICKKLMAPIYLHTRGKYLQILNFGPLKNSGNKFVRNIFMCFLWNLYPNITILAALVNRHIHIKFHICVHATFRFRDIYEFLKSQ